MKQLNKHNKQVLSEMLENMDKNLNDDGWVDRYLNTIADSVLFMSPKEIVISYHNYLSSKRLLK